MRGTSLGPKLVDGLPYWQPRIASNVVPVILVIGIAAADPRQLRKDRLDFFLHYGMKAVPVWSLAHDRLESLREMPLHPELAVCPAPFDQKRVGLLTVHI